MARLSASRRRAGGAVFGGVLWALVPLLFRATPWIVDIAVLAPLGLALGLLELHARYGRVIGRSGTAGTVMLGVGLASGFTALLANALYPDAFIKLLIVGLPGVVCAVSVGLGTLLLAASLWRHAILSTPLAVTWAVSAPASIALNAAVTPRMNAGLGVYGVAWVLVGRHLWRTSDDTPRLVEERECRVLRQVNENLAVILAGLGSSLLSVTGLAGVVPLGPVTALPFVGVTPRFDALHLVTGLGGLGSLGVWRSRAAGLYTRTVGGGYLLLALVLVGQLLTPARLVTAHWTVTFLHVLAGILLTTAGAIRE